MCELKVLTSEKVRRYDPTRTTSIRNAFMRDLSKRFRELRGLIRTKIEKEDFFGLKAHTSAQRVDAFMVWLNQQSADKFLQLRYMDRVGATGNHPWTNIYIEDAYQRGVIRGQQELKRAGVDVRGVAASMRTPFHADRLALLYTRSFNELKGITNAMEQQISRVLTQGIADGDNPRLLADKLSRVIKGGGADLGITDTLGRHISAQNRALMLARTEVIRAHHQATVQEYRTWEVEGVIVEAEWSTAKDFRVCDECESLEAGIYTLEEIENMIPVHPNCRCLALPIIKD